MKGGLPQGRAATGQGPVAVPMLTSLRQQRLNVEKLYQFRRFLKEDPGATYDLHKAFNVDPERDDEKSVRRGFVQPEAFVKRTRVEIKKIRKLKHRKFNEGGELVGVRIINEAVPRRVRERLTLMAMKEDAHFHIGRYGFTSDMVNKIRRAFCRKEVIRLTVHPPWKDNMKEMAKRIEKRTGGIIIDRAGGRVFLYRGFTDADLARKGLLSPHSFNDVEVKSASRKSHDVNTCYVPKLIFPSEGSENAQEAASSSTESSKPTMAGVIWEPLAVPVGASQEEEEEKQNAEAADSISKQNGLSGEEAGTAVKNDDVANSGDGMLQAMKSVGLDDAPNSGIDMGLDSNKAGEQQQQQQEEEEEEEEEETWRTIARREYDPMEEGFFMALDDEEGADDTLDRDPEAYEEIMDLFKVVETGNRSKKKSRKPARYRRKP